MFNDYYTILGVSFDATQSEIKQAYRKQVKKWHPDRNSDPSAKERITDIIEAYLILSNEIDRQKYDDEYEKYFKARSRQGQAPPGPRDKDLLERMYEAAKKAKKYAKGTYKDIVNIGATAIKESLRFVLKFLLILFVSSIVIGIIYTIVFELKDRNVKVRSLDSLPHFTNKDKYSSHNIPYFGTFKMPHTIERKTEQTNDINEDPYVAILKARKSVIYKATFQQRGLNSMEAQAKQEYARVLISTEIIQPNQFPLKLEGLNIKHSEIDQFYDSIKEQFLRDLMIMGGSVISWDKAELVSINDQKALHISYLRKMHDSPPVKVNCYFFKKRDTLRSITMSYRESDALKYKNDFEKILSSIQLTSNKLTGRINNNYLQVEKLNSLPYFNKDDGNVKNFDVEEFGSITLPNNMDSIAVNMGSEHFVTTFFEKRNSRNIQKKAGYAKITIMTKLNVNVKRNINSTQITLSELKDYEDDLFLGYNIKTAKIVEQEKSIPVSFNGIEAFKFSYTVRIEPLRKNFKHITYLIENHDRMHSIVFSSPIENWASREETFLKILESISIPSIYTNNQSN